MSPIDNTIYGKKSSKASAFDKKVRKKHLSFPSERAKSILTAALPLVLMCAFAVFSEKAAAAAADSLRVCALVILPSLFPMMAAGGMLIRCGGGEIIGRFLAPSARRLFGLGKGAAAAVAIGWICGFPSGAAAAMSLLRDGRCSREEAERASIIASSPSPTFMLGVVGGMLGNRREAVLLMAVQYVSLIIVGAIPARRRGVTEADTAVMTAYNRPSLASAFTASVSEAAANALKLCGFIVFFGCVTEIIKPLLGSAAGVRAAICALLEITAGVQASAEIYSVCAGASKAAALALAGWCVGFSGLSVAFQTASLMAEGGIGIGKYLRAKLLCGVICAAICGIFELFCVLG